MPERNSFISRVTAGVSRRWRRLSVEIANRTGYYQRLREVEWSRVERLVFVCSGNICRSPYAERVARTRGFPAVSIGITALSGSGADPIAIEVAGQSGIDLRAHESLAADEFSFSTSDLLIAMDIDHLKICDAIGRDTGPQVTLLGLWDGRSPVVIEDPFGGPPNEFEACFQRIDACVGGMLMDARKSDAAG